MVRSSIFPPWGIEVLGWCCQGHFWGEGASFGEHASSLEKVPVYPWLATLLAMVSQEKYLMW